jgi:DNA-binding transcriptional ArsR family regulator
MKLEPVTLQTGRPRKARTDAAGPADGFAALADATRRHLLERLADGDLAVSQLTAGLDMSQAAVSQHLRVLREAGLVTARKDGRHRYYQLRPAALAELRDWLDDLERLTRRSSWRSLTCRSSPSRSVTRTGPSSLTSPWGRWKTFEDPDGNGWVLQQDNPGFPASE